MRYALSLFFLGALAACNDKDSGDDVVGTDDDQDGWTVEDGDCDDANPAVYPYATDIACDGVDQDCSGDDLTDQDGDGHDCPAVGGDDCDDLNAGIHPDADDPCGDGIDTNCDQDPECDCDADGAQAPSCGGDDCDDSDAAVFPDAPDTCYDGVDSDCDGVNDYDCDGDGTRSSEYGGLDCDDADPGVNPAAVDTCYDGEDTNCDGFSDYDCDTDGHISTEYGGDDCDDHDDHVVPEGGDPWANGKDDDCDGEIDEDAYCHLLFPLSNGPESERVYAMTRDGDTWTETMTLPDYDPSTGEGEVLRSFSDGSGDVSNTVTELVTCGASGLIIDAIRVTDTMGTAEAVYDTPRTFLLPLDQLMTGDQAIPGAHWDYAYTTSDASLGDLWHAEGTYTVIGTDTIEVTAGTFDTLVIENHYVMTDLVSGSTGGMLPVEFDREATVTMHYAARLGLVYVKEVAPDGSTIETRELESFTGFWP
ncbi:MAG: hypothetical protein JXX28_09560 [Deltaproteobacteria bacterium]|nr:hypothetical protein [Deltaproteobacteria bacterium]